MIRFLTAVGRWLVNAAFLAFPRAFREAHREDALAYFEDRARAAGRGKGAVGVLGRVVADVASTLVAGVAERGQATRRLMARGGGLLGAVRHGLRALRRHPRFLVATALPVALGIAGVTAVFAVVDSVLLRPLPYAHPQELVKVGRPLKNGVLAPISTANVIDIEDRVPAFEAVAGATGGTTVLGGEADPTIVHVTRITRDFMQVFRLIPAVGRPFAPEEFDGPARVAMISWPFWQSRWGGDRGAVGTLLDTPLGELRIVAVRPESWQPPDALPGADGELWLPEDYSSTRVQVTRAFGFTAGVARLSPGATLDLADEQLVSAATHLAEAYPSANREKDGSPKLLEARPLLTETVGDVGGRLLLLLGAVGALLAIACANVANLFLARGTERERELAMRTVMGAGRGRIMVQLLTESLVVALVGGAVGCLLAHLSVGALAALTPDLPRSGSVTVDLRVMAVAAGLSVLCGVAFGLRPALTRSQRHPGRVLGRGKQERSGAERLRGALVVGQTALALVLVVGGGLLANSALRLSRVDTGFRSEGVLTFLPRLDPHEWGGKDRPAPPFYEDVRDAVARLPGVRGVTGAIFVPGQGRPLGVSVRQPTGGDVLQRWRRSVLPGFFDVLDIPVLEGRPFTDEDVPGAPRVAVVSRSLARELWPGESGVGRTVTANDGSKDLEYTVVGVVGDIRDGDPSDPPQPMLYEAYLQNPWLASLSLIVRHDGDPGALLPGIRDALHAVDSSVPLWSSAPLSQVVSRNTAEERHWAILSGVFSMLALLIAAVGVYATMSFVVSHRLRELGIRRAMGARAGNVVGLVVGRGMGLTAAGVVLGIALALAAARVLESILFEITPSDPATYAAVAGVLLLAALLACLPPAVRATRVDPLSVLRSD